MTLPNFLIIGAAKSGTTSIYHYLKEHPMIYMPSIKEVRFFSFDKNNSLHVKEVPKVFPVTNVKEYMNLFEGVTHEKAIGEASPIYLNSPIAAKKIKKYLPAVKLIVILRNPTDTIFSIHMMFVRTGKEKRSFVRAFRDDSNQFIENPLPFIEDPLKGWFTTAFYYLNLKRYFDIFDSKQIKVCLFEDLKVDALNTVREIYRFLQVEDAFTPDIMTKHNVGGIPQNKLLNFFLNLGFNRSERVKSVLRNYLPPAIRFHFSRLRQMNLKKLPLEQQIRSEVTDFYREDILKLQDLIKRDLSLWL